MTRIGGTYHFENRKIRGKRASELMAGKPGRTAATNETKLCHLLLLSRCTNFPANAGGFRAGGSGHQGSIAALAGLSCRPPLREGRGRQQYHEGRWQGPEGRECW